MKILHERFDFCHWMKSGDDLVTKIKLFKKRILKKISKFDELKHLILENFLNLSILMFMATLRHQFDDLLFAHFEKKILSLGKKCLSMSNGKPQSTNS